MNATDWVQTLNLIAHPEGGYFRETYRASEGMSLAHLPERFQDGSDDPENQQRSFATAIYYLLESHQCSTLHRIKSDEGWHFYAGSALLVYMIAPDGELTVFKLGSNPLAGDSFHGVVPAGYWFGAAVEVPASYALVGCTVAPGFDFQDFEIGDRQQLLQAFPQHREVILRLTRE